MEEQRPTLLVVATRGSKPICEEQAPNFDSGRGIADGSADTHDGNGVRKALLVSGRFHRLPAVDDAKRNVHRKSNRCGSCKMLGLIVERDGRSERPDHLVFGGTAEEEAIPNHHIPRFGSVEGSLVRWP